MRSLQNFPHTRPIERSRSRIQGIDSVSLSTDAVTVARRPHLFGSYLHKNRVTNKQTDESVFTHPRFMEKYTVSPATETGVRMFWREIVPLGTGFDIFVSKNS